MNLEVGAEATLQLGQQPDATSSRKRKRSDSFSSVQHDRKRAYELLPPSTLLLTLPKLFAVPPNHRLQIPSYVLSLAALRKCLQLGSLPPDVECQALTALAEIGMKIVTAGWSHHERYPWANALEQELETAIGRGQIVAQQSPPLVVYKQALNLLHARLAHWQTNEKFSRSILKKISSSFIVPSINRKFELARIPPWFMYSTHLTNISHALSTAPPDLPHAFGALQDLLSIAEQLDDTRIKLLTHVLRLRTLVDAGMWDAAGESLFLAETALGISCPDQPPPTSISSKEEFLSFEDPFEAAMAVHTLIMGVVYYTHLGSAKKSSPRLTHLHALLDSDVLSLFRNGTVDIKLRVGPPLTIKITHPRVLYHLAYLVSSVSKRDVVGRRPKRKVFSEAGLMVWEKEVQKEIPLNPWADPRDAEEIDERMVKIKADLLSELVAVCITRSEFQDANKHLTDLIDHTRTYGLFNTYAARITLHHAHLAHALGDAIRAMKCYAVAANLAHEGTFVNVSSRSGFLALRIARGEVNHADPTWEAEVKSVVEACKGMGGALEAVGHVLQASVATEILSAKTHLKAALDRASEAQDNYLRAFILAFVSALYLRTAEKHALAMLETCGQLAAGLGAIQKSSKDEQNNGSAPKPSGSVGNAPLGLWVGQRFLEIYRREGNESKARQQEVINAKLTAAIDNFRDFRQELAEANPT